jgi:hypothetical protein
MHMPQVRFAGYAFQIAKAVVIPLSVAVVDFHSFWNAANERLKNYTMNRHGVRNAVFYQRRHHITFPINVSVKPNLGYLVMHEPLAVDPVNTFKSGDCPPDHFFPAFSFL